MKTNTITLIVSLGIFSTICLAGHADEPPAEVRERSSLDLVPIPAGPFQMGDGLNELRKTMTPHWVYVSEFHIAKYAATKKLWDDVRDWAVNNGYHFEKRGLGKENDHPIASMNWFDVVKWCNALSQKAGLKPCYYEDAEFATVYTSGRRMSPFVKWDANGYRLPTEAEWEKAARGGLKGKRFPWGDTITHSQANYNSDNPDHAYDISPTRGYHPDYKNGNTPYTSPVGSFAPNGYGLYDMAGNTFAWCWDWDNIPYCPAPNPAEPLLDPHGPPSGASRSRRGGCWYDPVMLARTAYRFGAPPMHTGREFGLRLARSGEGYKAGWKNYDWGNDIAVDSLGKVYLASYRGGIKYDANGNQLWKIDRKCTSVAVDSSGNAYFTCYDSIIKCNADGKPLWEKGGKHSGVAVDSSGNAYVTGATEVAGIGVSDVLTVKYDAAGKQLWKKTSGGDEYDGGNSVAADSAGNVYVTGITESGDKNYKSRIWTIKYDTNGNQLWDKTPAGRSNWDWGNGIAVDSSGNVHVTGKKSGSIWVAKYDKNGNQLWEKTAEKSRSGRGNDIAVDASGNVYVTAETFGLEDYRSDTWTIKFDANGNQLWNKISGDGVFNGGYGIAVNSVRDIYVTGYTQSALNGSPDVWRIKYVGSSVTDAEKTQKETKPEKPLK